MFIAAGLSGVNLLLAAVRLEESPRTADLAQPSLSRLDALRLPGITRLTVANFVFAFAVTQLETIFALYMLDRFDYDALEVAMILLGMAIVMGGIQGGAMRRLSDRFGERSLIAAGSALLAAGFVATPWMPTVGLLLIPLAACAVGRALVQPSLMTLVSFRSTSQGRGSVISTFQSGASLARVVGPLAAGFAYDEIAGAPFAIAAGACLGVLWVSRGFAGRQADPTDPTAPAVPDSSG